jgi:hypothetical protein
MFSAQNGGKVRALFDGDTSAYGDDESRADSALVFHLAFWSRGDEGQIDRLFRQSELYREKWERADYRQRTIENALKLSDYRDGSNRANGFSGNQRNGHARTATSGVNLLSDFWESRECLRRIRQAAHSRHRSADAVFQVVLARVASMIEPVHLDTGVGSPASLNYMAAVVGPSGVGKTDAWAIACDLYPAPAESESWFADNQPLGTGEGLAECFMGTVEKEPMFGKGKPTTVRQQVRNNAFVYTDEGEALTRYLERSGAIVGETLRRAWKGVPLGQKNASADRTRVVKGYSLGLVIGFQHTTVQPLLRDVAAGTPQRFVFCSAVDASVPSDAVPWPEPMPWWTQFGEEQTWSLEDEVRSEIRGLDLMTTRGEIRWSAYDSHAVLTRVKIAGLLAALEMRKLITGQDWTLAGTVLQTSQAVRDSLLAEAEEAEALKEAASHNRAARREMVIEEQRDDKAMRIAIDTMARHVEKAACDGGCKRRCLTNSIAWKHRQLINVDQAIERAIEEKRFRRNGDVFNV